MIIIFIGLLIAGLFLLQQFLYRRLWDKGVSVTLAFEKNQVYAGERVRLLEEVENRKRLPLALLKVKFQCSRYLLFEDSANSTVTDKYYRNDLFSIMSYKKITRTHTINCPQRGYFGIYGVDLVGADLFFSEEMVGRRSCSTAVYVLPRIFPSQELNTALQRISGEVMCRQYELEDPFTCRGIREYEPHDEQKTINWKATARTGDLKVNIRDHTTVSSVRIFMNLVDTSILRRLELLEAGISLCAGIAHGLLEQGIRISLYANTRDCVTESILEMEDLADLTAMDGVNKALARLDINKSAEKFGVCFGEKLFDNKEHLFTVFLSPDRHNDYQEVLLSYKKIFGGEGSFLWLCPIKQNDEKKVEAELAPHTVFLEV